MPVGRRKVSGGKRISRSSGKAEREHKIPHSAASYQLAPHIYAYESLGGKSDGFCCVAAPQAGGGELAWPRAGRGRRQPGGLCDLTVKHGVVFGVLTVPGSRVEHVLVPRATIGPPPLESHWNHHWSQSHLP